MRSMAVEHSALCDQCAGPGGTSSVAQLAVYLIDSGSLSGSQPIPGSCDDIDIYRGMLEELASRGKRVETESDEMTMKSGWVKQLIHQELDAARESWLGQAGEAPIALATEFEMKKTGQDRMTSLNDA